MNKLESNKLLATLARLELQCVLGTEDGKFHLYYDPFERDYLFVGRWVDIWYEEDHPLPPPESRQVCNRGKNLDEISVGFKELYSEQIWSACRYEYLTHSLHFTNLLFEEWKKQGLESLDLIKFNHRTIFGEALQKRYEVSLAES